MRHLGSCHRVPRSATRLALSIALGFAGSACSAPGGESGKAGPQAPASEPPQDRGPAQRGVEVDDLEAEVAEVKNVPPAPSEDEKREGLDDRDKAADGDATRAPKVMPPKSAEPGSGSIGDELSTLEAELLRIEGDMRLAGVPLPSQEALAAGRAPTRFEAGIVAPNAQPLECKKACDLTDSICALADNICEMRDRHTGDDRYERACARASSDCAFGKAACDGCEPG